MDRNVMLLNKNRWNGISESWHQLNTLLWGKRKLSMWPLVFIFTGSIFGSLSQIHSRIHWRYFIAEKNMNLFRFILRNSDKIRNMMIWVHLFFQPNNFEQIFISLRNLRYFSDISQILSYLSVIFQIKYCILSRYLNFRRRKSFLNFTKHWPLVLLRAEILNPMMNDDSSRVFLIRQLWYA